MKINMKKVKVVKVDSEYIEFENEVKLCSEHVRDCCERHYLFFDDLSIEDFNGLEFDLTKESFFNRINNYGIELVPVNGFTVKIPGYGHNNGYYSSELTLVLELDGSTKKFDITDCQVIDED